MAVGQQAEVHSFACVRCVCARARARVCALRAPLPSQSRVTHSSRSRLPLWSASYLTVTATVMRAHDTSRYVDSGKGGRCESSAVQQGCTHYRASLAIASSISERTLTHQAEFHEQAHDTTTAAVVRGRQLSAVESSTHALSLSLVSPVSLVNGSGDARIAVQCLEKERNLQLRVTTHKVSNQCTSSLCSAPSPAYCTH